jgi:hypothetical protein
MLLELRRVLTQQQWQELQAKTNKCEAGTVTTFGVRRRVSEQPASLSEESYRRGLA